MDEIAAGKGKGAKPFMTGEGARRADAVWQSQPRRQRGRRAPRRQAAEGRAGAEAEGRRPAGLRRAAARQARSTGRRRAPAGPRDQVRRLPHAAARRGRQGDAADPQGPRLDRRSSRRSPRPAQACPTASSTARPWRSTTTARRTSPALQAALSDGKTDDLIFFAFDLLFADGEDLRALPLRERKARLKALLDAAPSRRASATSTTSRPPATRCCSRPAAWPWRASSPSGWTRPTAPAAARPGSRPSAAPATRW